jgi:transposase
MFQTEFSGSISDVTTLKTIVIEFHTIIGDYRFTLVMDKGFYSILNIKFMLSKEDLKFIVSIPLTNIYAKKIIERFKKESKSYDNFLSNTTGSDKLHGKIYPILLHNDLFTLVDEYSCDNPKNKNLLYAYTYYNQLNNYNDKIKKYDEINLAKQHILDTNKIGKYKSLADKYFIINYSTDKKKIISIDVRIEVVEDSLKFSGYFILLSNIKKDETEIYNYYRKRNVVEQAFKNYKNHLGLDRLYIQGHKRMVNKTFILFISLIIYSYIFIKKCLIAIY